MTICDHHLEHDHLVAAPREAGHVVGEDEREDAHVREHLLIIAMIMVTMMDMIKIVMMMICNDHHTNWNEDPSPGRGRRPNVTGTTGERKQISELTGFPFSKSS